MTVKDEEQVLAFEGGTVLIVGVARCKATGYYYFVFYLLVFTVALITQKLTTQ